MKQSVNEFKPQLCFVIDGANRDSKRKECIGTRPMLKGQTMLVFSEDRDCRPREDRLPLIPCSSNCTGASLERAQLPCNQAAAPQEPSSVATSVCSPPLPLSDPRGTKKRVECDVSVPTVPTILWAESSHNTTYLLEP